MMHKDFRAEKDQDPILLEEKSPSHPQYLDCRDFALQQRQHSLLLL